MHFSQIIEHKCLVKLFYIWQEFKITSLYQVVIGILPMVVYQAVLPEIGSGFPGGALD